ncbi:hypothetical protein HYC85_029992 [Camellia sinensis]|uniref:Transcription factor CBF/NF-Y/archaeal histone domain-containing protein n=1 Tax=Camellia sinensis TaxID=4442 RepID=A0A7J7G0U7_CAMSI|nr:hypothetical protein HYC85_029992 [Camellia sinensis]
MEPMDIVGKTKEDASLPKATMTKIIKEMLPPDVRVARDAQDLLIDFDLSSEVGAGILTLHRKKAFLFILYIVLKEQTSFFYALLAEFINLISSESNEVCSREEKRTIAPEHVLKALELLIRHMVVLTNVVVCQVLGFGEYIEEVYAAYEQHRLETMDTLKSGKWNNVAEMT